MRARVRLRPGAGDWILADEGRHSADASGGGLTIRLRTDLALGVEGNRVRARHLLR